MTYLKAISGHTGAGGIRQYLERGGRALAVDLLNLGDPALCEDWAAEMDRRMAILLVLGCDPVMDRKLSPESHPRAGELRRGALAGSSVRRNRLKICDCIMEIRKCIKKN